MSALFPVLRGLSSSCRSNLIHLPRQANRQIRQASQFAFRPTLVLCEPRTSFPPPGSTTPIKEPERVTPSRKPEDLYPESFPLEEKDLVNPSGRIYAVRRPPDEDAPVAAGPKGQGDRYSVNPLAVPLSEARTPPIFRPLLFFGLGSALLFYGAAYYSVKQTDEAVEKVRQQGGGLFDFASFFGSSGNGTATSNLAGIDERKLKVARKQELAEKMGWRLTWLLGWCNQLGVPEGGKQFVGRVFTWGAER